MKKYLIILAIVCVVTIIIITCVNINSNKNTQSANNINSITNSNTEISSQSDNGNKNNNTVTFWADREDWGEHKTSFDGTLFNESFTTPIDLKTIDEVCSPFRYFPNTRNGTNSDTISEILNSDKILNAGNVADIHTRTKYENGKNQTYKKDQANDNISKIYIKNYSDNDMSIKDCYQKGWFYIEALYNPDEVLGFPNIKKENKEYSSNYNNRPLMDAFIQKYGAPSYIISDLSSIQELKDSFEKKSGSLAYSVIYEYDDYVIRIAITDIILSNSTNTSFKVSNVFYYSKDAWKLEKASSLERLECK